MFVARSSARVRLARVAFLVLGLAPAVALISWALHRRSDAHRAAIERHWQESLGLPLAVGGIEHPRPGVIRGRDCVVPALEGRPTVKLPLVEVESSADEDRIRIGRFACDPGAAAVAVALARAWLSDDVRFRRTCIVEIADFHWTIGPSRPAESAAAVATPLRIECVARPGNRALRVVHRGLSEDELRIVRGQTPDAAGEEGIHTISVTAACSQPLPLAVLAVTAGAGVPAATAAGSATVTGTLEAVRTVNGWSGNARGRIEGVDLGAAAMAVGGRATGIAAVDVTRLAWGDDRVTDALLECVSGPGSIDGRLFDRIVLALGARPGPAAVPLLPGGERGFDEAACIIGVGPHGVQVLPTPRLPAGLASLRGAVLLAPPAAAVAGDRIAWMLSAPGTAFGPAIGPGSWLISVLPQASPPPTESGRQF